MNNASLYQSCPSAAVVEHCRWAGAGLPLGEWYRRAGIQTCGAVDLDLQRELREVLLQVGCGFNDLPELLPGTGWRLLRIRTNGAGLRILTEMAPFTSGEDVAASPRPQPRLACADILEELCTEVSAEMIRGCREALKRSLATALTLPIPPR